MYTQTATKAKWFMFKIGVQMLINKKPKTTLEKSRIQKKYFCIASDNGHLKIYIFYFVL